MLNGSNMSSHRLLFQISNNSFYFKGQETSNQTKKHQNHTFGFVKNLEMKSEGNDDGFGESLAHRSSHKRNSSR